jgi:hypothetical protein
MKYLSNLIEEKQSKVFDKHKVFFAFSKEQFYKGIEKVNGQGLQALSLSGGMILMYDKNTQNQKDVVRALLDDLETVRNEGIKEHHETYGASKVISQVYFNYESQFGDTSSAWEELRDYQKVYPQEYSDSVIRTEFSRCFQDAIKNEWI